MGKHFIGALARHLNGQLPRGFLVDMEQSLQIRETHPDSGERLRRPGPDLTVYRRGEPPLASAAASATATYTQMLPETLEADADLYLTAVVSYRLEPHKRFGRPVTQIELLSPTNKQGEGQLQYRDKRFAALKSGLALVEIDLLHETPPVVKGHPRYPDDPDRMNGFSPPQATGL